MADKHIQEDELIPEVEATEEEVEDVLNHLVAGDKRRAELERLEYDGVLWIPPGWVPVPIIERFRQTRDRVLDDWGYTPEMACEWMDRFCRIGEENDDWFYPGLYPNGRYLDTDRFLKTIGVLANLRWAISLGPEEGLKELSGTDTRLGYQRRNQLTEFGQQQGTDKHEKRAREWEKWREEGDRIVERNPRLAKNKSEIARRIKKNLNLTDAERTIRDRI